MAEKDEKKTGLVATIGQRKEALARVRLSPGNGQISINGKPIAEYFLGPIFQNILQL